MGLLSRLKVCVTSPLYGLEHVAARSINWVASSAAFINYGHAIGETPRFYS